jgi:toxin ParE1/3/4
MAEFKLTNKAVEDLSKIWDYTFETWSEKQADKYYGELIFDCQGIAENQSLGKPTKAYLSYFSERRQIDILFSIEQ